MKPGKTHTPIHAQESALKVDEAAQSSEIPLCSHVSGSKPECTLIALDCQMIHFPGPFPTHTSVALSLSSRKRKQSVRGRTLPLESSAETLPQAASSGPAEREAPNRDPLCCGRQSHPTLPSTVRGMQLLPESRIQLLPEVPVSLLLLPLHLNGVSCLSTSLTTPRVLCLMQNKCVSLPTVSLNHKTCCLTRPAGSVAKGSRSTTSSGSAPLQNTL